MALTKVSRGLLTTSIVDNGNATAITIDSSENVGIGTSSPFSINGTNLEVSDALYARVILDSTAGTRYSIQSLNDSSLTIYDLDADTERMRINSSGQLLIGTTTGVATGTLATSGLEVVAPSGQGCYCYAGFGREQLVLEVLALLLLLKLTFLGK